MWREGVLWGDSVHFRVLFSAPLSLMTLAGAQRRAGFTVRTIPHVFLCPNDNDTAVPVHLRASDTSPHSISPLGRTRKERRKSREWERARQSGLQPLHPWWFCRQCDGRSRHICSCENVNLREVLGFIWDIFHSLIHKLGALILQQRVHAYPTPGRKSPKNCDCNPLGTTTWLQLQSWHLLLHDPQSWCFISATQGWLIHQKGISVAALSVHPCVRLCVCVGRWRFDFC